MSHNTALHLHGPSPSGAMFRRRNKDPPKEKQGEEESNTLCVCRCEKHFSNTPCALFQVGPWAQGWETKQEFLSLSALEPSCRKADAPKGENKGNCQDTSIWCTRRRQPSLHHFLMAEENQNAAHRVLLPHSSWGFNAFCPVIKKLHRLQLNMENMIHPVSRAQFLHSSSLKRAARCPLLRCSCSGWGKVKAAGVSGELCVWLHLLLTSLPSF